ncbi:HAD hydrolase-like protein [Candidatus Woesearchaeota archaeon]|nr:HAD hydrolase-like protein [Candidatus Woesearchaeota archaeon]
MLVLYDLDDTLYSRSEQLSDNYTLSDLKAIRVFPGVLDLLQRTATAKGEKIIHVLVTKGENALQQQKIEILGIRHFFHKVFVCPRDEDKKSCFEQARVQFPMDNVWVVGNRLDSEIRYGKELGLKTIYLCHGKYSKSIPRDAYEVPDYEVDRFEHAAQILHRGTI